MDCFVEKVSKFHRIAGPAAHHFAIGTEHVAEANVHCLGRLDEPAGLRTNREDHFEVIGLRASDHVKHQVRPQSFDPVHDARQVTGGVHECARP